MPRRDAEGRLIRPARPAVPEGHDTVEQCAARARFWTGEAANLAGFCMSDHLDDPHVVKDMHDIIGALGAVQSLIQLMETHARKERTCPP